MPYDAVRHVGRWEKKDSKTCKASSLPQGSLQRYIQEMGRTNQQR